MAPRAPSCIVGALSSPLAVVLLVLFFVPWVDLKCSSTRVGSASDLQLTFGRMTTTPEFDEQKADEKRADDGPNARPGFILGLVAPLGLLAVCGIMHAGKIGPMPGGPTLAALAIVGLIVMIFAANVDYRDEIAREERELSAMFSTTTRGAVWVSLAFYILIGLLGAAGAVLPMAFRRLGAKGHASPTDLRGQPHGQVRGEE